MSAPRHTAGDDSADSPSVPANTTTAQAKAAKIREAVEARDALAAALTRAGIQLPAMDVRTPWHDVVDDDLDHDGDTDTGTGRAARYALVHLGVCSAPIAIALAAVITEGAGR